MVQREGRLIYFQKNKLIGRNMEFISKAISDDETRYFLNFAYCDDGMIISTDGHRLHMVKNHIGMKDRHFLRIIKATPNAFIGFEFKDDMTFPNYKRVIPDEVKMDRIVTDMEIGRYRGLFKESIGQLLYYLNKDGDVPFNTDYVKDVLSIGNVISVYVNKQREGTRAVLFKSGECKAIIMPISKDYS